MKFRILAIAALLISSNPALSKEPDAKVVAKEVSDVIKALYSGDYDLITKHTHEKVLEMTGGKKGFLAIMKESNKILKDSRITAEKVEVGKQLDYFAGKENEFLLVSTTITIKIGEKLEPAPGHQLGVKKKTEKVWKYIDCSALTEELVRKWFPDFPKGKKIPKD